MLNYHQIKQISVRLKELGLNPSEAIGTMLAHMEMHGILQEYLDKLPIYAGQYNDEKNRLGHPPGGEGSQN